MRIKESFRSSFKSLAHNKLRSFLTMLGIIIGVFSVILLTSISEGVKQQVTAQVESLGSNLLYVLPGKIEIGMHQQSVEKLGAKEAERGKTTNTLTYNDVLALKGQNGIKAVTGLYTSIENLDQLNLKTTITGTDEDLINILKLELAYGHFISKSEREAKANVAVIGYEANKELFAGKNSIGETFKINGRAYKVVGVLRYKKVENMGPRGEDYNVKIYIPVTEVMKRGGAKNIDQIIAKAVSADKVSTAEKSIEANLEERHRTDNFTVLKQQDMLNTINNILSVLTAALGGIAAISLIVGGIGIMNIMLVSVVERTREIGVRKAIGAKRRDILIQFLIESVILSIIGGLLGLGLGIGCAKALPKFIPTIHTAMSVPAIVVALTFALFVGIFFGVFPAAKAAKLDPIVALRSE